MSEQEAGKDLKVSKIILPIIIGVLGVGYLIYSKFDWNEFDKIEWNSHVMFWVGLSVVLLIIRHLAYAYRIRTLSGKFFSWKKSIELIFIWEFSTAVSPTSVGGSAVAIYVLAKEKLSTPKTAALVLYTVITDTFFFILGLGFFILVLGPIIIRPGLHSFADLDSWGYTFIAAYVFMAAYGFLFFYGLFLKPHKIKSLFVNITKLKWLNKYQPKAIQLGDDFITASKELKGKGWGLFIRVFVATAVAWSCRFLLLNALVIAFVPDLSLDFLSQITLFARLKAMFVIIAFSPTPGGAGFVEILFDGFLSDYFAESTVSTVVAIIWRLETYYLYLIAGAMIIPGWIKDKLKK